MKKILIKGVAVLLPTIILITVILWMWKFLGTLIRPNAIWISERLDIAYQWGVLSVVLGFCLVCLIFGWLVTTAVGSRIKSQIETNVLDRAPGYAVLRNIVTQLFGPEKSPFSSFAVVEFENLGLRVTGFITARSMKGWCTVFVPTGPNPTSGFIVHVKEASVKELNVSASDAFESIIGCGTGSGEFHDKVG